VVITQLTGSGDGPHNSSGMPSSDTSDLSVTSMGLLLQMLNTESLDDTLDSLTLGNSDNVEHLVGVEDRINGEFLLEHTVGIINLLGDGTTVDLDFHNVILLLSEVQFAHLGVGDNSDGGAVLLDSVESGGDGLVVLGDILVVGLEGFFLGVHPILVESSEGVLLQLVGPDGGQRSHTSEGIDVTDQTDDDHGGSLDDGHSLNDLLLVQLRFYLIDVSDDMGHTSLESGEGGQVDLVGCVVSGE